MPTPILILNCTRFPTAFAFCFLGPTFLSQLNSRKQDLLQLSSCIHLTVCRGSRSRINVSSVFPNVDLLKRKLSSEQSIDIEYDSKYDLGRDLVIIQKFPPTEYH